MWHTGEEVTPPRPRGDFSKTNWGDHQDTHEGQTYQICSTSNLVGLVNLLKKKQWDKILSKSWVAVVASASSEEVGDIVHVVEDVAEVMELVDGDEDLSDNGQEEEFLGEPLVINMNIL